jgi:hypothetical protein
LISHDEYLRIINDLQDFLIELHDLKKKRAQSYFFSLLQTMFLLFCAVLFYILHLKIDFVKEIVFLPLYCISVKDAIYHLKELNTLRKFHKQFKSFLGKS